MKDRFDLETAILDAWHTKDDLDLFLKGFMDHPDPMSENEVANAILGLMAIHDLRCRQLYEVYKQVFKLDEWGWLKEYEGEDDERIGYGDSCESCGAAGGRHTTARTRKQPAGN